MADTPESTATVAGQSIALHLTNYPDIPNRWGPGHIRPTGIRLDYGSQRTPDTRRATVFGLWIREDGQVTDEPLDRDYYAPTGDTSSWPDWIADLTRKHDPAPVVPPADRAEHIEAEVQRLINIRAAVLREAANGFDRHAEQILDGVGDKAVFVAKALRDQAAVWSEAAETLRRMANEAQPDTQDTKPWLTDSARIGRTLIWSWTDVGKGAFREGYRAAQAEARALLGGERGTDQQQPTTGHSCGNCEGIDPDTCLTNPDRDAEDAQRREPHPTEADLRYALAVAAKFHGQDTDSDRIVAYRLGANTSLHCVGCAPSPRGDIWEPVTSEDLPDGGLCAKCGVDVLIQHPSPLTPCTCRQTIHATEHGNRPVDDCPWCTPTPDIRPNRVTGQTVETVDTRLLRTNQEG